MSIFLEILESDNFFDHEKNMISKIKIFLCGWQLYIFNKIETKLIANGKNT